MERIPQISIIFLLTKKDNGDFNRNEVTQSLCITPTKTSGAELSKGKLNYNSDVQEISNGLSGITIIPSSKSPYQIIKHSYWCFEIPKTESWCLEEVLQQMEGIFSGKENAVNRLCETNNLSAELILRIYADSCNMPEITIPNKSISFWATMGVGINIDFYLN